MCQIIGIVESIMRLFPLVFEQMLVKIVELLRQSQILGHQLCASKVPPCKEWDLYKTKLVIQDTFVERCIVGAAIIAIS